MTRIDVPEGFSWSASRHGTFTDCPRAYFFRYYGSLGKAVPPLDPRRRREAYRLRHLTSLPMWIGSRVHDTIEQVLRATRRGEDVDVEAAIERMVDGMRRDYRASLDDRARLLDDPRNHVRFVEHEYRLPVTDEEWRAQVGAAQEMVRAFVEQGYLDRFRSLDPSEVLALEDLDRWDFEGVPVWVRIDVAWRNPDGTVTILDWKTGKREREDNPLQLLGYAAYARDRWDVGLDRLDVREVYLRRREPEKACRIDEETVENGRQAIRNSVRAMLAVLPDPARDAAAEDRCEPRPGEYRCRYCPFRALCPAGKELVG